jgi:hypothetical protein
MPSPQQKRTQMPSMQAHMQKEKQRPQKRSKANNVKREKKGRTYVVLKAAKQFETAGRVANTPT